MCVYVFIQHRCIQTYKWRLEKTALCVNPCLLPCLVQDLGFFIAVYIQPASWLANLRFLLSASCLPICMRILPLGLQMLYYHVWRLCGPGDLNSSCPAFTELHLSLEASSSFTSESQGYTLAMAHIWRPEETALCANPWLLPYLVQDLLLFTAMYSKQFYLFVK